jgi:hypothetical protein
MRGQLIIDKRLDFRASQFNRLRGVLQRCSNFLDAHRSEIITLADQMFCSWFASTVLWSGRS